VLVARSENQNIAGGRVIAPDRELVSRTTGRFTKWRTSAACCSPAPGGARVPLRDIAAMRDTSQEQRFWARLNGVPAVRIGIQKQPEANTVEVVDGVRASLDRLQSQLHPARHPYRVTFDQSGFIRDALNSVRSAR
jgi:multidrug efflux pump subunit AcrB